MMVRIVGDAAVRVYFLPSAGAGMDSFNERPQNDGPAATTRLAAPPCQNDVSHPGRFKSYIDLLVVSRRNMDSRPTV